LSAYILGGLPIVFGGYLLMARGDYLHPLFHDPMGLVMLVMMAVLFVVGVFWLRKIVRVEA
jgi:tight adherence protein B